MITVEQLETLTGNNLSLAEKWCPHLNAAMAEFEINTPTRTAMFLAQIAHESGGFVITEESLFYRSAERLCEVWPARFKQLTPDEVAKYVRNSVALANFVYGGRMGNGDEASGDGYKFRGRGLIQLTGRLNYAQVAAALMVDLLGNPDQAAEPETAARIAGWFWQWHGCNALADADDFTAITQRINGGQTGQLDRLARYDAIAAVIA